MHEIADAVDVDYQMVDAPVSGGIAAANGGTLTWDANGNLTSDGFTTFKYDAENRLIRMTTRSESELPALGWQTSPPRRELHFKYDIGNWSRRLRCFISVAKVHS